MWCWGYNGDGQLGNGETGGTVGPQTNGFVGEVIDAFGQSTCAIDRENRSWCWGRNNYGQLGLFEEGSDEPDIDDDVLEPTLVVGELTFDQISGGEDFACGVTATGSLYCWGRNTDEKLGLGQPFADLRSVTEPTRVGSDSDWVSVSLGNDHACALRQDGSLWCWGKNNSGQLGVGDTDGRSAPTRLCF